MTPDEFRSRIAEGLLALHNEDDFFILEDMPCCEECGLHQLVDEQGLGATDPYCFYHSKDVGGMGELQTHLSWGCVDEDAHKIVQRMTEAGLVASWDGHHDHRVHVRAP